MHSPRKNNYNFLLSKLSYNLYRHVNALSVNYDSGKNRRKALVMITLLALAYISI